MLSDREQRALEEIERSLADAEAASGGGRRPDRPRRVWMGDRPWVLVTVAGVGAVSVFLMIAGAGSAGPALAVAGALGWLLRHYWPWLRDQAVPPWTADDAAGGGSARARASRRSAIFQRSAD